MTHADDLDQARQQAQDLLVHIEELLAKVSDPAKVEEAVANLGSVVCILDAAVKQQPAGPTT